MYNEKHPQEKGTDFETHSKFFWTPFWTNSIPEWVDDIDNACQVHLDIAHEREKDKIEKNEVKEKLKEFTSDAFKKKIFDSTGSLQNLRESPGRHRFCDFISYVKNLLSFLAISHNHVQGF